MAFKEKLLENLDDRDVIEKIRNICLSKVPNQHEQLIDDDRISKYQNDLATKQEDIRRLQAKIDELSVLLKQKETDNKQFLERIRETESELTVYKNKIGILNNAIKENEKTIQEMENKNSTIGTKLDKYENSFSGVLQLYDSYMQLSESTRSRLSRVINEKSILSFISSCSRYETIEGLWDYLKTAIINDNETEQTIHFFKSMFDNLFELYNYSSDQVIYKRCSVRIDDDYDDELHIRGSRGFSQGKIKDVQLLGYMSAASNKIIRKSVVISE